MQPTIYHNPACGTSRTTLALLESLGYEPTVIEYLKTPPSRDTLSGLARQGGMEVRDLVRQKEALYVEMGLNDPAVTDEQLLDAMVDNPILINRPIVSTKLGVRLCRPAELVREILPPPEETPVNTGG
jgi:arsenate reductase